MAQKTFPNNYDEKELISDDDLFLLADSQSWLRLKKIKWSRIRQNNGDLYKYSIVPSISSWNLTVALKNYLWQDPSVTTPVKVQIWDTVRTITSALSVALSSWWNWLNLWSSELATKENDIFVYLYYSTVSNAVWFGFSRLPSGHFGNDFTLANDVSEKSIPRTIANNNTDIFKNIGRFSAILSAGAWYTWSTPSAWFQVINYYINETKWLDYVTTIYGAGWSSWSFATSRKVSKYKLVWNTLYLRVNYKISNAWSWTGVMGYTLPFAYNNDMTEPIITWYCCQAWTITNKWLPTVNSSTWYFLVGIDTWTLNWWTVVANDVVNVQWFYSI